MRRRPWLLAAWLAVALALFAAGLWLVELSPLLVARSVSVEGVKPAEVAAIVDQAAVPMGTPLARVDTDAIAQRVIGHASLAQVTVTRSYPSTIVISGRPRQPVLVLKNPQGQLQVVDSQGVAYAVVSAVPKGVPLITSVQSPPSQESMHTALAVLRAVSQVPRHQVTDVTVVGENLVTLKLGAVTVVWGGASEPELKVKVITVLLRQKGVQSIDVSAPHTPVVR